MTSSPKNCRSGQRCQPVTLREALHCQAHHSDTRLDELARRLGISASTLANAVNPDDDTSLLAPRHYERLLGLTHDNLTLVAFLASLQHAVVYPVPRGEVEAQTAATVKEFGELLTAHAQAHADHRLTRAEADEIGRQGHEAIVAIAALIDDAARRAEGPR